MRMSAATFDQLKTDIHTVMACARAVNPLAYSKHGLASYWDAFYRATNERQYDDAMMVQLAAISGVARSLPYDPPKRLSRLCYDVEGLTDAHIATALRKLAAC